MGVGAFASQIERMGYRLHGIEEAVTTRAGQSPADISRLHAERSREVTRLRNVAAELEDDIAALQRERANLNGQPQALAGVTAISSPRPAIPPPGRRASTSCWRARPRPRSEAHSSEHQSLMRTHDAAFR